MQDPVLSICIPTFNRAEFLKECLASIIPQLNGSIGEKIEVVISDNGSTDHTKKIAEEFLTKYKNIRYFKNAENIGFDRNVFSVVEKAKGDYCWLLGDDDALFEGSLEYLIPLLEKRKYGYLLANAWGFDRELKEKAVSFPNLGLKTNQAYSTLKEFVKVIPSVKNMVGYFGGMSCQIFKRETWQSMQGKEKYIGTQTVHMFIILNAFKTLPALVVSKPLVKVRADNMRWETFPGLETVKKRAMSTNETQKWIFESYEIPYSGFKLKLNLYFEIIYSTLYSFARNSIFKSQKVRNFFKKIIGL